jgi:two-component system sensor kinase FixL
MNTLHRLLTEQLSAVLQEYIAGGGEAALLRSYDLGRSAVAHHMNVLEVLAVQQEVFMAILLQRLGDEEGIRLTRAAAEIFAESLAPFELAKRSSQEGSALLRLLNAELERQVAERTQELRHAVERLAALHSIDRAILAAESIEDVVRVSLSLLRSLVLCDRASVHVFDETGSEATLLAVDAEGGDATEIGTRSPIEFYGDIGSLDQVQVSVEEDLNAHSQLAPYLQSLRENGVRSYVRVPLGVQGNTIGFIYLSRYNPGSFSPDHLAIAQEVADQIAIALQQARLHEQVQHHALALQRQRDFAESLIETAHAIVLVLDREGRIVRFNPYMESLSGYRLAEVQGKSGVTTFIPERLRNRVQAMFSEAMRSPQTYYAINPIVTRDGHEREIEWSSSSLKDTSGSVIGLLSIGQDITERERAQAALRNLIETTQDAVITVDAQGRIELFNPAAEGIFGYVGGEVLGQKVNMLMPEPYAAEHGEYMAHAQRTGERRAVGRTRTVAARRKSGEIFPIEISLAEIRIGNEVKYGAFIRDISEKLRLQERLLERERLAAIGTTAATFAHEVGNPLNSMYLSAQLLDRRLSKNHPEIDEKARESLHNLTGEIKRLIALLQEFRSLARRSKLDLRSVSLTAVVAEVLAVETLSYTPRGITVGQSFPPDLPLVWADVEKIKQVVLNLCKNAAEAMPGGGELTVSATNFDGQVRLEITDTGVGIPAGVDVFEPFVTTKTQGTGLGLTIVRQIVAAHNGKLTYRSVSGEGTTFTLTLPAAPQGET